MWATASVFEVHTTFLNFLVALMPSYACHVKHTEQDVWRKYI